MNQRVMFYTKSFIKLKTDRASIFIYTFIYINKIRIPKKVLGYDNKKYFKM